MSSLLPPPGDGRVDLWYTFLGAAADQALGAEYRALLNPEETARCDRFLVEKSRQQYLVTRALVRTSLAGYLGIPPAGLVLAADENGKPFLPEPAGSSLRFNASHTSGLAVCAVAGEEIGADAEEIQPDFASGGIVKNFFSAEELSSLSSVAAEERQARFYQLWTLKEAFLKGLGKGLSVPLADFTVRLISGRPAEIVSRDEARLPVAGWKLGQLRLADRFQVAIAVRIGKHPLTVCLRQAVPLRESSSCKPLPPSATAEWSA